MSDNFKMSDIVKDWYFNNPNSTIRDAAEEFGIPRETVKNWCDAGGWVTKRASIDTKNAVDSVKEQADHIRLVLYEKITSTEMSADDLSELVKAWKSMAAISSTKQEGAETTMDRDDVMDLIRETD